MARAIDWLVWLPVLALEVSFLGKAGWISGGRALRPSLPHIDSAETAEESTESILQQVTRIRDESTGGDALFGTLRAEFTAGQRVDILHVAFCPPLEKRPQVYAEQADGPHASVRVTHVLPQGARLEVRLAQESDEPAYVTVDFAAN